MQLSLDEIDRNLLADLDGDAAGWTLHEMPYEGATVSNQRWQVVLNADGDRAGIVFCGSGSSGQTYWTDASSPEDAVRKVVEDDIRN